MLSIRAHGWTRDLPPKNFVQDKVGSDWDDLFRFVLPGYNLRPIEFEGALGVEQLAKLPELLAGRRSNAKYFQQIMSEVKGVRIQEETGTSSWFGFAMILEGVLAGKRHEVVKALTSAGIETRPIVAGNFTRNPVMKYLNGRVEGELKSADKVHFDGLFIGNHHYPVEEGLDLVKNTLNSIC